MNHKNLKIKFNGDSMNSKSDTERQFYAAEKKTPNNNSNKNCVAVTNIMLYQAENSFQ